MTVFIRTALLGSLAGVVTASIAGCGRGKHHWAAVDPRGVFGLGGWPALSGQVGHYLLSGLNASLRGGGDGIVGLFCAFKAIGTVG